MIEPINLGDIIEIYYGKSYIVTSLEPPAVSALQPDGSHGATAYRLYQGWQAFYTRRDPEPGPTAQQWRPGTARPRLPVAVSGVRLQILTLLREHPKGLTPVEVQECLGCPKDLAPTIRSMARDGLLHRVAKGVYTAAAEE